MRKNKASVTAQGVAAVRAIANLKPNVPGFSDPMAEHFLTDRFRKAFEKAKHKGVDMFKLSSFRRAVLYSQQFRTVILDRAIKDNGPAEQLVILGAGLDARAWRLDSLHNTSVFEIDHPASQAYKQSIIKGHQPLAREMKFVPVDFTRDKLEDRLLASGFDPKKKSTWILEGLTMYLSKEALAGTLRTMSTLAAPGSRVAMTYLTTQDGKSPLNLAIRLYLWFAGEPIRSHFGEAEMSKLAEPWGWKLASDSGIRDWAKELTPNLSAETLDIDSKIYERIWVGAQP